MIAAAQTQTRPSYHTDDERWSAVAERDTNADGAFVYCVKTTGVFCRPSCAARLARRENVTFCSTAAEAKRQGYRPCLRCGPDKARRSGAGDVVTRACESIAANGRPPSLAKLAGEADMSPSHFHRLFKVQTGLTPRAYAAAHRAQRMRAALSSPGTVTSAIYRAGFNSSGRFYDESNRRLGMRPAQFKAAGKGVSIRFAVGQCSLGSILVAASELGICSIMLGDEPAVLVEQLQDQFSRANLIGGDEAFERTVARVVSFVEDPTIGLDLPLHIRGTAFQQRVWEALSRIPCGSTRTYAQIAASVGRPSAVRAVAGACAANPVAVAIPCHRVVRTDGSLSGYRWGVERKAKLLAAEGARR